MRPTQRLSPVFIKTSDQQGAVVMVEPGLNLITHMGWTIIRMLSSCGIRIRYGVLSASFDERTVNAELTDQLVDRLTMGEQIPKEIGRSGLSVLAGSV